MDGELVSSSLSSNEGSDQLNGTPLIYTYTKTFEDHFPYYLSIGMTANQYWDEDCALVKYYRKADEMKTERQNFDLWLQGKYIYDAMCAVSPIFHAFAKKGTKPQPYPKEPYPITTKSIEESKQRREVAEYNKNKAFMETFMVKTNRAFESKGKEVR